MRSVDEVLELKRDQQKGITGTDIAKILGYSDYGDARTVYHSKTRPVRREDVEEEEISSDMERGLDLEPVAKRKYREKTGREGRDWKRHEHPDKEHFIAHVDWEIFSPSAQPEEAILPEGAEGTGILEVKCPSLERFEVIAEGGLRDSEYLQLLWYLLVTRRRWGGFGLYNPYSRRVRDHVLTPDLVVGPDERELIRYLEERMDEFWRGYVLEDRPPDPVAWEADSTRPEIPDVGDYMTIQPNLVDYDEVVEDAEIDADDARRAAEQAIAIAREYAEARSERMDAEDREEAAKRALEDWFSEFGDLFSYKIEIPDVGKFATVVYSRQDQFDRRGLETHRPIDRDAFERARRAGVIRIDPEEREKSDEDVIEEIELDLDRFVREGGKDSYVRMY